MWSMLEFEGVFVIEWNMARGEKVNGMFKKCWSDICFANGKFLFIFIFWLYSIVVSGKWPKDLLGIEKAYITPSWVF